MSTERDPQDPDLDIVGILAYPNSPRFPPWKPRRWSKLSLDHISISSHVPRFPSWKPHTKANGRRLTWTTSRIFFSWLGPHLNILTCPAISFLETSELCSPLELVIKIPWTTSHNDLTPTISFLETSGYFAVSLGPHLKSLKYIPNSQEFPKNRTRVLPVRVGIPLRGFPLYLPCVLARGNPGVRGRAFRPFPI